MRIVRDEEGDRYLLVKRSAESRLVRDPETGAERYLPTADLTVETHETYQPVSAGIVDLATDIDADLVVIGGRQRSPTGKALFGSVTQSVVLDSPVPVVVVGVE